jgi:flavonoid 3'-monooxygenase
MVELAKKYGPIMYLRLGYLNYIVISNAEMAMEVLKIHDANFASRPQSLVGKYARYDCSDIIFSKWEIIGVDFA